MSTFPGRVKSNLKPQGIDAGGPFIKNLTGPGGPAEPVFTPTPARPTSDSKFGLERNLEFDAGLNSSAAWTEHLHHDVGQVGSDDDNLSFAESDRTGAALLSQDAGATPTPNLARTQPARVLYDFGGNPDAQELLLRAGEEIEVLQERMEIEGAEGWSLAHVRRRVGQDEEREEVGLVPREYYAFTTDFLSSPSSLPQEGLPTISEHSDGASTPRPSTYTSISSSAKNPPLIPQNTGEWFRQQMRSVLGGRSLNRFSRFVTSGAEAFVLHGAPPSPASGLSQSTQSSSGSKDGMPNDTDGLPSSHSHLTRLSAYLDLSSAQSFSSAHTREPTAPLPEASPDTHYIDADDAGPVWREKVPAFAVRVHNPVKRYPDAIGRAEVEAGAGAYIVYSVTSIFSPPNSSSFSSGSDDDDDDDGDTSPSANALTHSITVPRRFSHFVLLHQALSSLLPSVAFPPLPRKQYAGRMREDFVEARRRELERWLRDVIRHPLVRYCEPVRFFLGCEDEVEFRRQLPSILSLSRHSTPYLGRSFFANVYHPPFQIDLEDATEAGERFENHLRAVSRGVQELRGGFGKVRGARIEMSNAERLLSYEILSLITSRPLSSGSALEDESSDDDEGEEGGHPAVDETKAKGKGKVTLSSPTSPTSPNGRSRKSCGRKKGLQNSEGAWCWREDCADCLRLTKCMQKTAETLQGVADLFDSHARRTMFETEDSLKEVAHPDAIYAPVLDIHKQTLERYREASSGIENTTTTTTASTSVVSNQDLSLDVPSISSINTNVNGTTMNTNDSDEEDSIASRCETVLNTTLAEFDAYHAAKRESFEGIVKRHLDGEIAFYEKVLTRLRTTRALFDAPPSELELLMPGPRAPSVYERELQTGDAPRMAAPLVQPAPHVLDGNGPRSAMRPVSEAIQSLFGFAGSGSGSGSGPGPGTNGGVEKEGSGHVDGDGSGTGSVFSRLW